MALSPRRVEVSIGEVVVDGVPVEDRAAFEEALQSHLGAVLASGDPARLRSTDRLDGGSVRVARGERSGALGAGVARAVGRALGGSGDGPVTTQ